MIGRGVFRLQVWSSSRGFGIVVRESEVGFRVSMEESGLREAGDVYSTNSLFAM